MQEGGGSEAQAKDVVVGKAHSCENVTDPVTFFQKMSYRGYILFRIRFHSNFF